MIEQVNMCMYTGIFPVHELMKQVPGPCQNKNCSYSYQQEYCFDLGEVAIDDYLYPSFLLKYGKRQIIQKRQISDKTRTVLSGLIPYLRGSIIKNTIKINLQFVPSNMIIGSLGLQFVPSNCWMLKPREGITT